MCLNEVGINARRSVALLAELLFYNSSLRNCLLENQTVCLDRSYFIGEPKYDTRYRSIVMECVSLIGRLVSSSGLLFGSIVNFFAEEIFRLCRFSMCRNKNDGKFVKALQRKVIKKLFR